MAPMGLQVIGAGFGRTGTLSLKAALDELGVGPTYHMQEVLKRPSHLRRWHRFATTGAMEWDALFAGWGSGVDYPVSCVWRELAERWPGAKVVLTTRDPDAWWRSTMTTIYRGSELFPPWCQRLVPLTAAYVDMNERLVWGGTFGGRFAERDHAVATFRCHEEEVRAALGPDRLLVFEVADGWEPLCAFLGVPVPDRPFPRLNDAAEIRRRMAAVRIGIRAVPFVALGGAGFAAARALSRRRAG